MGQSPPVPPAPPTPPLPSNPLSKTGRIIEDEAELPSISKRQKMGTSVSVEEWMELHQVTL
jgi:hypothetical protein